MIDFEEFKERYQKVPVEEYPNRVVETMPEPMVSVHVGTYQHADFIHACVEGVLMQETEFPFEIIIGEDESDDGTREICKEYAEQYPEQIRLFLHRRENNIHIRGRPTGKFQQIHSRFKCRGKYIALCQGDDYWTDPKKLQKQVDFLEANPEYVLSFHEAKKIDISGNALERSIMSDELKRNYSAKEVMASPPMPTMSLCYRNVLGEFPPEYFEVPNGDIFLVSLLGQYGKAKYHDDIEPAAYRIHQGSVYSMKMGSVRNKASIESRRMLCRYYGRVGKPGVAKEFERQRLKWMEDLVPKHEAEGNYLRAVITLFKLLGGYLKERDIDSLFRVSSKVFGRVSRSLI
jgi:glycosyltransferase involved in cell wall biosynthesis